MTECSDMLQRWCGCDDKSKATLTAPEEPPIMALGEPINIGGVYEPEMQVEQENLSNAAAGWDYHRTFLTVADVERSLRFYETVFGGAF